jgi:transposase
MMGFPLQEALAMMGKPQHREAKLFYTQVNIEDRVAPEHSLRKVAAVVDFSFVRGLVAGCYGINGHESLDPTVVLKLIYLAFAEKLRSERELLRVLPCRLDWLWFLNLDLDSEIPHHSVLSKARQLWGPEIFEQVFAHVLKQCQEAGLVEARTWHVDSTVLKGHLAADRRIPRQLWNQLQEGLEPVGEQTAQEASPEVPSTASSVALPQDAPAVRTPPPPQDTQAGLLPPPPGGPVNARWLSATDPDAAAFTKPGYGMVVGYKDHRLIDDRHGVIVASVATPADYDDGGMVPTLLEQARRTVDIQPHELVGDSMYGTEANFRELPARNIRPYLKKRRSRGDKKQSWLVYLPDNCSPGRGRAVMRRRRAVAERSYAVAHDRHGHRRCRWRRRWRVQIQCYMVASVQNIQTLARHQPPPKTRAVQIPRPATLPVVTRRFNHEIVGLTDACQKNRVVPTMHLEKHRE